jgi:hypothetical protein
VIRSVENSLKITAGIFVTVVKAFFDLIVSCKELPKKSELICSCRYSARCYLQIFTEGAEHGVCNTLLGFGKMSKYF